jgi:hypothetical protein
MDVVQFPGRWLFMEAKHSTLLNTKALRISPKGFVIPNDAILDFYLMDLKAAGKDFCNSMYYQSSRF